MRLWIPERLNAFAARSAARATDKPCGPRHLCDPCVFFFPGALRPLGAL